LSECLKRLSRPSRAFPITLRWILNSEPIQFVHFSSIAACCTLQPSMTLQKIHIGDVFFPMRSHKEPSPHELYLRAFTAAKPLVPLKLYANVTGKFTVERELGTKITDRVRERTLEAEKQRQDRQAIFLDAPPTLANTKKRKPQPPSSAVRKTQQHERTASSSTVTMSASPLPPTPPQKSDTNPLGPRIRMIRCISQQPRTEEEVVLLVGGQKCTSSYQQELTALLRDVIIIHGWLTALPTLMICPF
jgi:RNA polymerase II elongation factor ELL